MPKIRVKYEYGVPVTFLKEGEMFVAYSPVLDLSTCGQTYDEASQNMKEAAELFFEDCFDRGTIDEALSSLGWRKSTSLTAHQARAFINSPVEVKVLASALLRLARWCRERAADPKVSRSSPEQGGSPCPHPSPPAPRERCGGSSDPGPARATLAADSPSAAAGTDRTTDSDARGSARSSRRKGAGQ